MGISIIPVSSANQTYTPPVVNTGKPDFIPLPASTTATSGGGTKSDNPSASYEAAIKNAASSYGSSGGAGSYQEFAIFKDADGKFITRYTNPADGSVTYVPAATLLKHIQENTDNNAATRVSIKV